MDTSSFGKSGGGQSTGKFTSEKLKKLGKPRLLNISEEVSSLIDTFMGYTSIENFRINRWYNSCHTQAKKKEALKRRAEKAKRRAEKLAQDKAFKKMQKEVCLVFYVSLWIIVVYMYTKRTT